MDTTQLNPEDAVELAELRRRADGTTEGISADQDPLARLEQLESAARWVDDDVIAGGSRLS